MQALKTSLLTELFKPRSPKAHKGDFGHVLIVGGDFGYMGAALLAGSAALRVGAGLVSVATRLEHTVGLTAARPELMCHGVSTGEDLEPLCEKASVIVIGPGLGQSEWARDLMECVFEHDKPMVVDADALNLLACDDVKKKNWIITPHPGEAARLLNTDSQTVQKDRLAALKKLQVRFGGVTVLKGHNTLVCENKKAIFKCTAGNPGMASGGMGDVLTGVIAGLVAQHFSLLSAAKLGVLVHARAGDSAALHLGQRGLLASDLIHYLMPEINRTKK